MKKATTALHRVTKERFPMSGYKFTVTNRVDKIPLLAVENHLKTHMFLKMVCSPSCSYKFLCNIFFSIFL